MHCATDSYSISEQSNGLQRHQQMLLDWLQNQKEAKERSDLPASWYTSTSIAQHRKWHRLPIERSVKVTPTDHDADSVLISATTKDMSPDGISFIAEQPVPFRRVKIDFDQPDSPTLEVELTWCRFTRDRMHQCGGIVVGITTN